MITNITVPARQCKCEVCGYTWLSFAPEIPVYCSNIKCRSREWNGVKTPQPPARRIKLPAPRRSGRPRTVPEWAEEQTDL